MQRPFVHDGDQPKARTMLTPHAIACFMLVAEAQRDE